jgi:hypothetical protein
MTPRAVQPLKTLVGMRAARGVLIVHTDGAVTALLPKPLAAQVAHITQRKHYKEAIGVARDALARAPPASAEAAAAKELIAHTEAKFAAHLLERACEPEAAMQHYIQTIGCVTKPAPLSMRSMPATSRPSSVQRGAHAEKPWPQRALTMRAPRALAPSDAWLSLYA